MAGAGFPDGFTTRYDVRQVGTYRDQCTVVRETLRNILRIEGDITIHPSAYGYALFDTARENGAVGDWGLVACHGQRQVVLDVDEVMGTAYVKAQQGITLTGRMTEWILGSVNKRAS